MPTDPTNAATPADADFAKGIAEHMRDLKAYIQNTILGGVNGGLTFYQVLGANCFNNAVTPDSKYDIDSDAVKLFVPATLVTKSKFNPGPITCDIAVAGPAANGRDQAGAFANDSWCYFYYIYNPTTDTLATTASATPPPNGPTLPAGYTYWAFVGAVRINSAGSIVESYIRGDRVYYQKRASIADTAGSGQVTTATLASLATLVPPNAEAVLCSIHVSGSSQLEIYLFNSNTNSDAVAIVSQNGGVTPGQTAAITFEMPNVGQQFYWRRVGNPASAGNFYVQCYKIPNGG